MKALVVISGGFHPFHAGHMALYNAAKKAFPSADVVVGATNDTKTRPFPFKIKQKLAQVAGVDAGHFVEVDKQFSAQPANIAKRIKNQDDTVLIFVRSDKDKGTQPLPARPDPKTGQLPLTKKGTPVSDYLLDYAGNEHNLQPMTKHAYMAYLPTVEFGGGLTSASEIRNNWPKYSDEQKADLVMNMYPATQQNKRLIPTVIKMLDAAIDSTISDIKPKTAAIDRIKDNPLKEVRAFRQSMNKVPPTDHSWLPKADYTTYQTTDLVKILQLRNLNPTIAELISKELQRRRGIKESARKFIELAKPMLNEATPEQKLRFTKLLEDAAIVPCAIQLSQYMTPRTREEALKYLDTIRTKYGKEFSLRVYRLAQQYKKQQKEMPTAEF